MATDNLYSQIMRFKILLNEEEKEIEVIRQGDRLSISYDGQSFEARIIYTDGPHFVLEVEEHGPGDFIYRKRIRAAGYRDGDKRQLWANGRMVNYSLISDEAPAISDPQSASLSPTIPAVVSEILIELGQAVKSGDKLILLESMKMIIPIQSPCDGVVTAVNCSPGEAVQPGHQLVDIEEQR